MFIMDVSPVKTRTDVPKPQVTKRTQTLTRQEEPAVIKESPKPATKVEPPRVENTEEESLLINYEYWELGSEENLERESPPSAVESSEVKSSSAIIESSPRPKPRPVTKPAPKPEVKPQPKPEAGSKPEASAPKPSGGLRCEEPKDIRDSKGRKSRMSSNCNQNGIRQALESVLDNCNTVRCYVKLFHYETECRPYLTHKAIVTAYGMCSIEKDYNLRKRFGSDCHKIDTVEGQIKCCRKMMVVAGKKYYAPVKEGRLPKCE